MFWNISLAVGIGRKYWVVVLESVDVSEVSGGGGPNWAGAIRSWWGILLVGVTMGVGNEFAGNKFVQQPLFGVWFASCDAESIIIHGLLV